MWLTWGRRLDRPAGRPLTPAGLRTAEVTARSGLQTPKARLPGGGARSRFAYGRDRQYSATEASRRREQGRPEGPPVRYPQGSDNRGNLAATRGAALGTASSALLLTGRAHNCGAHKRSHHHRQMNILTNHHPQPATTAWADSTTDFPYALSHMRKCAGNHIHTISHLRDSRLMRHRIL